jgi:hypothetical protein
VDGSGAGFESGDIARFAGIRQAIGARAKEILPAALVEERRNRPSFAGERGYAFPPSEGRALRADEAYLWFVDARGAVFRWRDALMWDQVDIPLETICPDEAERAWFLDTRAVFTALALSRVPAWLPLHAAECSFHRDLAEAGSDGWRVDDVDVESVGFSLGDEAHGEYFSMPLAEAVGEGFEELVARKTAAIEAERAAEALAEAVQQAGWRRDEAQAYADDIASFAASARGDPDFDVALRGVLDAWVEREGQVIPPSIGPTQEQPAGPDDA